MHNFRILSAGLVLISVALYAVETKTWTTSQSSEFEKGTSKSVSISSDGKVTLAPAFREVYDPAVNAVWSVAADGKGTIWAGASGGKLLAIDPQGKGRVVAEIPGGDIYAVAVGRGGDVYAAVSPDAKVYRVRGSGKPELFYDSKEKYIWAIVVRPAGDLILATGDQGKIHRVTPDGKGSVVAETGETHVRSLALDASGNVIAGTEPGGLILRVSATGETFVLYQTARREVTSLAVAKDGVVYAAAVGTKGGPPVTPPPAPVIAPVPTTPASGVASTQPRPASTPPPTVTPSVPAVSGGSEVVRIEPDGAPRRIWTSAQQVVYALALDAQGRLVAATGNQGLVYRIDSERVSTRLVDADVTQFTSLAPGPAGQIYAAAANAGKIFQLGPGLEKEGTVESDVFDATMFTYWGRLRHEGQSNGGSIAIETRSGNLERQFNHWSPWAAPGERVVSPPARFLAWRATLKAAPDGSSPVLSLVEATYMAKNAPPSIERIEVTPANYKFSAPSLTLTSSASTLTLPPLGQPRRTSPGVPSSEPAASQTMSYEKGSIGARWRATDPNGDTLTYRVEIRGVQEQEWKLLKEDLREARHSWDSTSFADGEYRLRVQAADGYDNYPGQALKDEIVSEVFRIDNTPPSVTGLEARVEGLKVRVRWQAVDALSPLVLAEYAVNGGEWISAEPTSRITDSSRHAYDLTFDKPKATEITIAVRMTDEADNTRVEKVVVR